MSAAAAGGPEGDRGTDQRGTDQRGVVHQRADPGDADSSDAHPEGTYPDRAHSDRAHSDSTHHDGAGWQADVDGSSEQERSPDDAALARFITEYGRPEVSLPSVTTVIAAYNEEESIGQVLAAMPETVHGLPAGTLVVVDGSSDDTAAMARKHGAYVCDVPVNRGQGAALRLGYRIARVGGAEYIVTTDADGQYDPAEIQTVMAPLISDEADFVTGSRRLGQQYTDDALRHLGVYVFSWVVSVLTGQRITDTTFGMRAMRAEVTADVELTQPQYQASELLIGVLARGYRVLEVPGSMLERTAGASKKGHNVLYGYRYARVVLGTWWRERRDDPAQLDQRESRGVAVWAKRT